MKYDEIAMTPDEILRVLAKSAGVAGVAGVLLALNVKGGPPPIKNQPIKALQPLQPLHLAKTACTHIHIASRDERKRNETLYIHR